MTGVPVEDTARRSGRIFERLAGGGQLDHAVLWDQLTGYVAAKEVGVARAAWDAAAAHASTADPERLDAFVSALATRAYEAGEYHEEGDTDAPKAAEALLRVCRARLIDLDEGAQESISELVSFWGRAYYEDSGRRLGRYAVGLLEVLRGASSARATKLVSDWGRGVLDDLNASARSWLASRFSDFDEEERAAVIEGLAPISNNVDPKEEVAAKYRAFMGSLSDASKDTKEIAEHLANVASQTVRLLIPKSQRQQYADMQPVTSQAQNYLPKVMPAVAPLLAHMPQDNAVALLDRAFSEGLYMELDRSLFGEMHADMVGKWPNPEEVDYDAEVFFDQAETAVKGSSEIDEAPGILRSMASLVEAAGLDDEYLQRVSDTACVLWPYHAETALETILRPSCRRRPTLWHRFLTTPIPTTRRRTPGCAELALIAPCTSLWKGGFAVTQALLERGPAENAEEPDWALGTWLDLIPDQTKVLEEALSDSGTVDEDLERLWTRIVTMADALGPAFFQTVLPLVLAREGIERTASAMHASKDQITELHDGPSARNDLGRSLLEALVVSPRRSDKGFLAQWIKDAGATGSLGHLNRLDPSDEDLEILEEVFSGSRRFREYLRSRNL